MTITKYPQCMLPTSRGLVPHLTKDYADLLPYDSVELGISSLFESDLFINHSKSTKQVFHLDRHANICSMAPSANPGISVLKNSISFRTNSGKRILTFDQLAKSLGWMNVDAILAAVAGDEREEIEHLSVKGKLKSYQRTVSLLDLFIAHKFPIYAPVIWDGNNEFMQRQAKYLKDNEQHFLGYWMSSSTLTKIGTDFATGKPKIVVGCSNLVEILQSVDLGGDIFDSRYAAELTEEGCALTGSFEHLQQAPMLKINLWNPKYKNDTAPILEGCPCLACTRHTKCYIHHLLNVNEMLGLVLLSHHNLFQFSLFFQQMRNALQMGTFTAKKNEFLNYYCSLPFPFGNKRKLDVESA